MAQALKAIDIETSNNKGLQIITFNGFQQPGYDLPLLSLRIDGELYSSIDAQRAGENEVTIKNALALSTRNIRPIPSGGISIDIKIRNLSKDTIEISNIVPFGESNKHVYLTHLEKGDPLSQSFIFRPDYAPVNVTLPDNSWNIGIGIVDVDNGSSIVALSKINKSESENVKLRRFKSILYPGAVLTCNLWMDSYIGRWQEGFRLMFQKNMLYDAEPGKFDNHLYERSDLKWINHSFVGHFVSAWHNYFYDGEKNILTYRDFEANTLGNFGGDDYMILWTGFPVLGLDQRNQWDLMRSKPGGVEQLRRISDDGLKKKMHLMTNYTPWDLPAASGQLYNSTRYEDPMIGLGKISQEAGFWGVMFDTRSESGRWFQDAMDKYRSGYGIFLKECVHQQTWRNVKWEELMQQFAMLRS